MMKEIRYIFIFLFSVFQMQGQNSVLSQGDWYKFSIDKTGVFKIDASFLRDLGVNTDDLTPNNIKIYGNGGALLPENVSDFRNEDLQENAIYIEGAGDGAFNNDDFILFYGIGPHSWDVNTTDNTVNHIQNIYTDKSFYFLNIGNNAGKRINPKQPITGNVALSVNDYDDYVFYEREETNLLAVGKLWFGENFSVDNNQDFSIPFSNAVPNAELLVKVAAVTQSSSPSTMTVTANGETIDPLSFSAVSSSSSVRGGLARYDDSEGTVTSLNESVNINLVYNNNGNPSANAYLDFIEVFGKKELSVNEEQFSFRNFEAINSSGIVEYNIQNNNNIFQVWDVSSPLSPQSIENQDTSGGFIFNDNGGDFKEYIVLNENDFYEPEQIEDKRVSNQNLLSLKDIQYLIITNDELSPEAQRLADYHQNNSNLTAKVVLLSEIYNEFSSGGPDIVGIRDFIKHLHDESSANNKLEFVCFFGDSSYDFKDRISENNNIVPTFHAEQSFDIVFSYVTDDFFVMIEEGDGDLTSDETIDVASGRIPVTTSEEAKNVVDKILNYYSINAFGDWRNTITLAADDIDDASSDDELQSDLERVADSIVKNKPIFNVNKIYADSFQQESTSGGERYPDVNEAIVNAMEKGSLVFDYFGHGGEDGLGSERYLEISQIENFNNINTLPLFITVTCEFARFDNPLRDTAGENLFLNKNGGSVSMITTTRAIFISVGAAFNVRLAENVLDFNEENKSIAQNLMVTKNATTSEQRFFIYYFGDPAMRLAIPQPSVNITKMNGIDVSQSLDTIKGLSKVSLEGVVTDNNNVTLSNFNGTISTTIFDKPIDRQTLDNDGFGIINTFDTQESKLFKGKSSVMNGLFKLEFVVPKDVKIAYGKGKVSMYAENQEIEKGGANFDIVVGGINENAVEDNLGPEIQAFMNNESFIDGGITGSSPNLLVKLEDVNGINTSITAVDHDIVLVLDGNQADAVILNDFYETALDDFTRGEVNYQLKDLSVGQHTLTIKAWDTYNNSSEVTLNFEVLDDSDLSLENVLNYPNPFVNYTEFWFNHNKPNESLNVQVQIFTISGKIIKTINQKVQTTGNLSRSINWNGLDDFGNKIGKGVYVYKLKVTSDTSDSSSEKYEKLVIL